MTEIEKIVGKTINNVMVDNSNVFSHQEVTFVLMATDGTVAEIVAHMPNDGKAGVMVSPEPYNQHAVTRVSGGSFSHNGQSIVFTPGVVKSTTRDGNNYVRVKLDNNITFAFYAQGEGAHLSLN